MNAEDANTPPELSLENLLQETPLPPPTVLQQAVRYEALPKLSTGKECVHLRGLPVDAQPETIMQFLGPDARNVIPQGVHIICDSEGQPSKQAIIQMDSEHSAFWAVTNSHDRFMEGPTREPSRIEALLCSVREMEAMLADTMPGSFSTSEGGREPEQQPTIPGRHPVPTRPSGTMATAEASMPPTFVSRDTPSSAPRPTVPPEPSSPFKLTWVLVRGLPESTTDCDIAAYFNGSLGLETAGVYMAHLADHNVSAVVGIQCRPETVQAVLNIRQFHYIGNSRIYVRVVDAEYVSGWLKNPTVFPFLQKNS